MHSVHSQWSLWSLFGLIFCLTACGEETPELPVVEENSIKTSWTQSELDKTDVYAIAGDYYEIQIGIKGKELTGVYRDPQAGDDTNCSFFFEGIIGTQNPIEVSCYNPTNTKAPFKGFFKILGDAMIIKLSKLPESDCNKEFTDKVGRSVVLDTKKEWSAIRMVQHATNLHENPILESPKSEVALKRGTAVAVLEQRNTWLRIEILDGSGQEGWISEHGLYPLVEL
jgi:hypothetical protein